MTAGCRGLYIKYRCTGCTVAHAKQVTWLQSTRSKAQVLVCFPACGAPGECYYSALLCCNYFSWSSVVLCAFSALCVYSKFGHHPHPLGSGWPCSSTLQNNEIRLKMFSCFWSNTLELTPIGCSWPIIDIDSVLCASEDCVILQSIRNTNIAPTWQFRL